MDMLLFLRETVFVLLIIFLFSNWVFGQLAAEKYDWSLAYKGAIRMLKVAIFFVWTSFIAHATAGVELFGWSFNLLLVPLMGMYALYYFQSALNNGVHLTGKRFKLLDDFDAALKRLFDKSMPETLGNLPKDPLEGAMSSLDLQNEIFGDMEELNDTR